MPRLLLAVLLFSTLSQAAVLRPDQLPVAIHGAGVNINTASVEELQQLKGVGPAKAAAIVSWRQGHGAFRSADDLDAVKGIGQALIDRNRDRISVR